MNVNKANTNDLFRCDGYRAVRAEGPDDAAMVFAERMARAEYGRAGGVRALRCDSWSLDGERYNYEAFIGRDAFGGCSGRNVWFQVVRG